MFMTTKNFNKPSIAATHPIKMNTVNMGSLILVILNAHFIYTEPVS